MLTLVRKIKESAKAVVGRLQNLEKLSAISRSCQLLVVGRSRLGREIKCYQFGQGNKGVIFIGAIHGNEVGTTKLAHRLINYCERSRFDGLTIYVIPCLNPDGQEVAKKHPDYRGGGRQGRFNANQVDLNRNFPSNDWQEHSIWSYGKQYSQKSSVYCGSHPGSEKEVEILCEFIKHNNIKTLFSFHNVGHDVMGNNNQLSKRLVELYTKLTGFHLVSESEWEKMKQTGTAKKWCEENDISYVEIEIPKRWGSDWKNQRKAIVGCLNLLNN